MIEEAVCRHDALRALALADFIVATTWRRGVSREQRYPGGMIVYGNCAVCQTTLAMEVQND